MKEESLQIPPNTTIEERLIITDYDVVIGSHSKISYGIKTSGSINAGERVKIEGDVEADQDVSVGLWGFVDGNLEAGGDAYIGERSRINGELLVDGNLEIGNDVEIEESFEANGWITINNPIPIYIYFFLLLSELIRRQETEEIEEVLNDLSDEELSNQALIIPKEVEFGSQIKSPSDVFIGRNTRFIGNLRGEKIVIDEETTFFGGIKSKENVEVREDSIVHGDIEASSEVYLEKNSNVLGNIKAKKVRLHKDAHVNEKIKADEVVIFPKEEIEIDEEEIKQEIMKK